MDGRPCARRVLAVGDFAMVERCSCGSIHLTIGAITLRLVPDALTALTSLLGDASRSMVREQDEVYRRPSEEALS